jgi:hypothetical protein
LGRDFQRYKLLIQFNNRQAEGFGYCNQIFLHRACRFEGDWWKLNQ